MDMSSSSGVEDEEKPPPPRYSVGYALAPKKVESFIQPSLLNLAKQRGIHLVQVDLNKPLISQGPFQCLLHKLSGHQWNQQLRDYSSLNPNVPIIDPPEAIDRLLNRVSMLQVVNDLELQSQSQPQSQSQSSSDDDSSSSCSFGIPYQILVPDSQLLLDPSTTATIHFPVIAKPLLADGTANSHQMALVFNQEGLKGLEAPVVLQEFVNHGGVLFKVYVVGDYVQCVKRRSLPDIAHISSSSSADKLLDGPAASHNLLTFSQISNLAVSKCDTNSSSTTGISSSNHLIETAQMPPVSFLTRLANALRKALSLHLFNFDVIRDTRFPNRYLVIDINYFPGYAKMPSYETVLTDFFLDILHHNQ